MTKSDPIIPRAELKPGIDRCIAQTAKYLESARHLLDASLVDVAAGTYALGIQEAGKAQLLREAIDSGLEKPRIDGFNDHYVKVQKAAIVLGSSALWLTSGPFQSDAFQQDTFDVGVRADESTRRDMVYVNYGSTGWESPPSIEPAELRAQIEDALRRLPKAKEQLLTGAP